MIRPFSSTVFAVEHDNKENVQEWHSLFQASWYWGQRIEKKREKSREGWGERVRCSLAFFLLVYTDREPGTGYCRNCYCATSFPQCAWREPRHKTRIMTSNIHFRFALNGQKPTLRHITWEAKDFCCEKESDGIDHCSGNNPTYDNKSYFCQ